MLIRLRLRMGIKQIKQPKICKEVSTGEFFKVYDYEDLGNGHFIAKSKRKLTKKEVKEYGL